MQRFIATLVIAGLTASLTAAQTRLFCRFTGVEIVDCPERSAPPVSEIQDGGCCVRRVFLRLDPSTGARSANDLAPVLPVLAFAGTVFTIPRGLAQSHETSNQAGPPLFVQHRALLI